MTRRRQWLAGVLQKIHALAAAGRVEWTEKAYDELKALDLELDKADVLNVLMHLGPDEFCGRQISIISGDWMYLFLPQIGGVMIYLKLVIRWNCVIISFHEDEPI